MKSFQRGFTAHELVVYVVGLAAFGMFVSFLVALVRLALTFAW